MRLTLSEWSRNRHVLAQATRHIYDADGSYVQRGDVGDLCDVDVCDGYVIVDFPSTGPILCEPSEIRARLHWEVAA